MKKTVLVLFLAAAPLFSFYAPAHATIEENIKQASNRFSEARAFYLAGKNDDCARILRSIMLDEKSPVFDRGRAARLLAELLRFVRSPKMIEENKKDLEKFDADFKTLFEKGLPGLDKEFAARLSKYLDETLKPAKRAEPETLESFLPLDAARAVKLGQYAESMGEEDPVRAARYSEALWEWIRAQNLKELTDPGSALSKAVNAAALRVNDSFWAKRRTFDREGAPSAEILAEILKKFSEALQKKDENALRALFHPDALSILTEILPLGGQSVQYSGFGLPQISTDRQTAVLSCLASAGGAQGPKTVIFRKSGDQWLIEKI